MGYGNCNGLDAMFGGGWMAGGWLSLLIVVLVGTFVVTAVILAIRPRARVGDGPASDPPTALRTR